MASASGVGRSAALLRILLDEKLFTVEELAGELDVPLAKLRRCRAGIEPLPLEQELLLAVLVVDQVPKHARQGHQLWEQVMASIANDMKVSAMRRDGHPKYPRRF